MKRIVFLSHIDMNLYLFRKPIMEYMLSQGWQVIALSPEGAYSNKFRNFGINHISYPINRGSLNPITELLTIFRIWKTFILLRPTLVHTFTIKPNIYGTIAAQLAGVQYIVNSITGVGSYIQTEHEKSFSRYVIVQLYKVMSIFTNRTIFQNGDDQELFINLGISNPRKIRMIKGSGVNLQNFNMNRFTRNEYYELRKLYGITNEQVVVTCVARLLKDKGVIEFCEAARLLKKDWGDKVAFLLVGDYYDGNPTAISKNYINQLVATNVIKFLGWKSNMPPIYMISDLVTLPSYREGLPVSLQEAMAMGLPIVTTNVPGCRETVDEGTNGILVPHKDVEALMNAIDYLVKNPTLRQQMGLSSRKKAELNFDAKKISEEHNFLYCELIKENTEKTTNEFMFRLFDLFVTLAISPVIVPILFLTFILSKYFMGTPVFFTQLRPGKYGLPFKLYKFRSMTNMKNIDGKFASDETRLTKYGSLLRRTSIDELPSLWNVLRGDMSIVGPRPLLLEYLKLYTPFQSQRNEVKPGITGWAQIKGRNAISWDEKFALDVWYVNNKSIWVDIKIIIMTIKKVIFQEDIHAKNMATMEKYQGIK